METNTHCDALHLCQDGGVGGESLWWGMDVPCDNRLSRNESDGPRHCVGVHPKRRDEITTKSIAIETESCAGDVGQVRCPHTPICRAQPKVAQIQRNRSHAKKKLLRVLVESLGFDIANRPHCLPSAEQSYQEPHIKFHTTIILFRPVDAHLPQTISLQF